MLFRSKCLRTVSRDELMSAFCERPTAWGKRLFTPCQPFTKGPKFMNIVMTFVLHPLSHYVTVWITIIPTSTFYNCVFLFLFFFGSAAIVDFINCE